MASLSFGASIVVGAVKSTGSESNKTADILGKNYVSFFFNGTNQTSLYIDHAQSSFVSLPFTYPSKIKLLSTQPSCLNVPLTSVVHLRTLPTLVVKKIRKSKSFVDKYFSSGRRAIRFVSGLKRRFI